MDGSDLSWGYEPMRRGKLNRDNNLFVRVRRLRSIESGNLSVFEALRIRWFGFYLQADGFVYAERSK